MESALEEIETKIALNDRSRSLLLSKFEELEAVCKETVVLHQEYYDFGNNWLNYNDSVLRLRFITDMESGHQTAELTFKKHVVEGQDGFKSAEEKNVCLSVRQAQELGWVFQRMGMAKTQVIEKRRTEYEVPPFLSSLFLDEIPRVGWFLELEGEREEIEELAEKLGFSQLDFCSKPYSKIIYEKIGEFSELLL